MWENSFIQYLANLEEPPKQTMNKVLWDPEKYDR